MLGFDPAPVNKKQWCINQTVDGCDDWVKFYNINRVK